MKAERNYPRYTVTVKAENAILRGHPWVYAEEITDMEGTTENGGLVDVISRKGRYLGTGMISEVSKIRVRLLSRNATTALMKPSGSESSAGRGNTAKPFCSRRIWTAAASFSAGQTLSPA